MADYDNYEADGKPRYPRLTPHFPIDSLTPSSKCPHKKKYRNGVRLCCVICDKSGVDHYRVMKRNPRTDPKPEPSLSPKRETRKAKRIAKSDPKKPKNARVIAQRQRLAKLVERTAAIMGLT